MRRPIAASIMILSTLLFPPSSFASSLKCSVTDPAGDPDLSPGTGFDGAAYQDILTTGIELQGKTLVFSMEVAAPIPAAPALQSGNGRLLWMWGMSTGPGAPQGFPIAPGVVGALEFWIDVQWDGTRFSGEVVDRRPALTGGDPIVTSVPFTVEGTRVTLTAPASLFGDLQRFRWGSSTWMWSSSHLGTSSSHVVDRAPNGAASSCPSP